MPPPKNSITGTYTTAITPTDFRSITVNASASRCSRSIFESLMLERDQIRSM
jgi:hypothetical protein